jgi:ER membrane protein complex subunit 1
LTLVLTSSPPSRTCGIYILDTVKGSVVYHASVPAAGGACDVQATLTENWLVYHYFDDEPPAVGQSKDIESSLWSSTKAMVLMIR